MVRTWRTKYSSPCLYCLMNEWYRRCNAARSPSLFCFLICVSSFSPERKAFADELRPDGTFLWVKLMSASKLSERGAAYRIQLRSRTVVSHQAHASDSVGYPPGRRCLSGSLFRNESTHRISARSVTSRTGGIARALKHQGAKLPTGWSFQVSTIGQRYGER